MKIITVCAEYNKRLVRQMFNQAEEELLRHKGLAKKALSEWAEKDLLEPDGHLALKVKKYQESLSAKKPKLPSQNSHNTPDQKTEGFLQKMIKAQWIKQKNKLFQPEGPGFKKSLSDQNPLGQSLRGFKINHLLHSNPKSLRQTWGFIRQKENYENFLLADKPKALCQLAQYLEQSTHLEIYRLWVPGSGEIPLTVKWAVESMKPQAVLALGVIIRGKTSHYDFLCRFGQKALWDLQSSLNLPVIFSVIMAESFAQAEERVQQKKRGTEGMKSLLDLLEISSFLGKS